jgi:hypothetical protein
MRGLRDADSHWRACHDRMRAMDENVAGVAAVLSLEERLVRLELNRAIRRSEPDAREVAGLIRGKRFVARRANGEAPRVLALEERPARPQPPYGARLEDLRPQS